MMKYSWKNWGMERDDKNGMYVFESDLARVQNERDELLAALQGLLDSDLGEPDYHANRAEARAAARAALAKAFH
jgi:hypothetical protein